MNLRDRKFWDLLTNEMTQLAEKTGIAGFFFGDLDLWDIVFARDLRELLRTDPDGEQHYLPGNIIEGSVVNTSTPCGLTGRAAKASLFLAKVMRKRWAKRSDALVWMRCSEEHQRLVAESDIVPQTSGFAQVFNQAIEQSVHQSDLGQIDAGRRLAEFLDRRNSVLPTARRRSRRRASGWRWISWSTSRTFR
jgi:hypothetical protein